MANCGFCLCHTVDCLSTFISSLYATIAPVILVHNVLSIFTWYIGTCACVAFWQKIYAIFPNYLVMFLKKCMVEYISCKHVIRYYHDICKRMITTFTLHHLENMQQRCCYSGYKVSRLYLHNSELSILLYIRSSYACGSCKFLINWYLINKKRYVVLNL